MDLHQLAAEPTLWYPLLFVLGAVVGSFLNVVILRLPKIMQQHWRSECEAFLELEPTQTDEPLSLSHPPSTCPSCNTRIKPWQNIPILSWLMLRGKCANCSASISIRYPIIELMTALLSVVVAMQFTYDWGLLLALVTTWCLVALTVIDAETQLLPDDITLPLLWLGLVANAFGVFTDLQSALWGAVFGYGILWSIYWIFKLTTGKEGMGYGDFKLLGALGALLGWQALPMIILMSSAVGAIIGIALMATKRLNREQPMPFGPYLAIAGWLSMVFGNTIASLSPYM
jgi:leader peptidase (prepilin peptidase)/N-methyltransferase